MPLSIALTPAAIAALDLQSAIAVIQPLLGEKMEKNLLAAEQQLQFQIEFPREAGDPRELSEIPEIRLWFIRLDAQYPWLPFLLDWRAGELARYTAMLVPHQFHPKDGILYNPEGLEIFVMQKIFVLHNWLHELGLEPTERLQNMTQMLGYELDASFFELL